jgi:predicted house-cleaning noncanonical NTP pyrophosphatase (MazG superfamily)
MCKSIGDMAKENDALKQHVTELENRLRALWDKLEYERKHYMERIKRLEEAGDAMEVYCDAISAHNWNKAKEAKP